MISIQNILYSAGMKPPIRIRNDVILNRSVMPSPSLRELFDFSGSGKERTLRLLGWKEEDINNLRKMPPKFNNPHRNYLFWHKGQTHCHSNNGADGDTNGYTVEKDYKEKGYTFVCLTNHNGSTYDPGVKGVLHITSAEDGNYFRHHICIIGINFEKLNREYDGGDMDGVPKYDTNPCSNIQPRIDYVTKIQDAIAILNHPTVGHYSDGSTRNCDEGYSFDDLLSNSGYTGIEIFTAACNGTTGAWSVEWWDKVVPSHKACWGFAADDHETHQDVNERVKNFNRGWITVNSAKFASAFLDKKECDSELRSDILSNIKHGNFSAIVRSPNETPVGEGISTTGPKFRVDVFGNLVIVESDQKSDFLFCGVTNPNLQQFSISPIKGYFDATHAIYKSTGNEVFVRVEIEQTGIDGQIYRAYSQPLMRVA